MHTHTQARTLARVTKQIWLAVLRSRLRFSSRTSTVTRRAECILCACYSHQRPHFYFPHIFAFCCIQKTHCMDHTHTVFVYTNTDDFHPAKFPCTHASKLASIFRSTRIEHSVPLLCVVQLIETFAFVHTICTSINDNGNSNSGTQQIARERRQQQ